MKTLIIETMVRSLSAVLIGSLIGSERARHGRAAGLTTAAGGMDNRDYRYSGGLRLLYRRFDSDGAFSGNDYFFAKFERRRKSAEVIYIELDNLYKVNATLAELEKYIPEAFSYQIFAPKSNHSGNVGINLVIDKRIDLDISRLTEIENVAFAIEE